MSEQGLHAARAKMAEAGIDPVAIDVFAHYYRLVERGETGMIREDTIEPLEMDSLTNVQVDDAAGVEALRGTVVIKLNGGLGTSMGMDRAKSLREEVAADRADGEAAQSVSSSNSEYKI